MNISGIDISQLKGLGTRNRFRHRKLIFRLKRESQKEVDQKINKEHQHQFVNIDCLECANCCKTTSPIIMQKDIEQITKYLKVKPGDFIEQYIIMDEDGDFVFNQTPCPFLNETNHCTIYDSRPKACREYPHTQQRKQMSIMDINLENASICPAVFRIFEYLDTTFPIK